MTLFTIEEQVVHIPFLLKGELIEPPRLTRVQVQAAFNAEDEETFYAKIGGAQVVRERLIDRDTLRPTDEWLYIVMPTFRAVRLLENDPAALAGGPYALPVEGIFTLLESLRAALQRHFDLVARVKAIVRATSAYADPFLDWIFATLQSGLDTAAARRMIERELSFWGISGERFLEGWVELEGDALPDIAWLIARNASWHAQTQHIPARPAVRAMPTRQLHITAGNSPTIPFVSALRMLLTKSVGVIKLPMSVTVAGGLFAALLAAAAPDHPLVRHLSVVYWKGGDPEVEEILFQPNAFDRIVVWGAPGSVNAVQSRALFTRTITLNPRYGISIIAAPPARQWTDEELQDIAVKAALDVMIYGQNACNASFVQYVEGEYDLARRYAETLASVLQEWDTLAPPIVPPPVRGQVRRLRRGKQSSAEWFINSTNGDYTSAVVLTDSEFDLLEHPLNRFVVVRPVPRIADIFPYLHAGVSTIGMTPESARLEWRDRLAATGVTNILPLGQCERLVAGMPHDGMVVLNQLVEWKQS